MWGQDASDTLERLGLEAMDQPLVAVVAGVLLLALGRRIYWLLVALAGFVLGCYLFLRFADPEAGSQALILGAVVGVVGAVLVVMFQKVALAAVGFVAGGLGMLYLAGAVGHAESQWIWVAALVGAVAGALIARSLFDLALIVLTSVAGAALVTVSVVVEPLTESALFVALVAAGVLFQLWAGRRGKKGD